MENSLVQSDFNSLGLSQDILSGIQGVGYETPSAIQEKIIPLVLTGRDVIGQAQTGTGKTAAFACPLLSKIDLSLKQPQVLVLTPTRELAIQVSKAFEKYAANLKGFSAVPIYGGQDIRPQLKRLKRGAHVVVGTPGRVLDHLKRSSLVLASMKSFVLDEADEMLKMGFVEDIDKILSKAPEERQIALFSATMPDPIRSLAKTYLHDPEHVSIKVKSATCENIRQRYCYIKGSDKLEGLTRILETENYDAVIVFVRTKNDTVLLAGKLRARGYTAEALSGDVKQAVREKIVDRLRKGQLNIVIATDVAARGIDVDRVTHVVNYDIPYDTEAYIHRIGRTGRAGRVGDAILFVSPREKGMLKSIERATKQKIPEIPLPSINNVTEKRTEEFKKKIVDILQTEDWEPYLEIVNSFQEEHEVTTLEMSAALCALIHERAPLFMKESIQKIEEEEFGEKRRSRRPRRGASGRGRSSNADSRRKSAGARNKRNASKNRSKRQSLKKTSRTRKRKTS